MTVKVSVIVATYRPGSGLDRLVGSIDAQTLPTDRFEVVFVDDGSPDDTVDRLMAVAAARPNIRVERIENSGWASRPRNVGLGLASGEYVVFMDHDDELYPDALRAAVEFADRHGADVVNGKEARTHDAGWALDTYRADRGQDVGRADAHPLVPMNPHKLYRRTFLEEHGIRFPEGRRVLWEDIFFNVEVAAHARTISTLSSVPFYHWVETSGSGSTTFKRSDSAWWDHLERVLESIEQHLGHDDLQAAQLRRHQYRSRILSSYSPAFLKRPSAERRLIEERGRALQLRFMDAADDAALDRGALAVARALRTADSDLLAQVAAANGIDRFAPAVLRDLRWNDGVLELDARSETVSLDDAGATFPVRDGLPLPPVPEAALDRLGERGDFDLTGELLATEGDVAVRGRSSRIGWFAESTVEAREIIGAGATGAKFRLDVSARIDVRHGALGAPLGDEVWDVFVRSHRRGRVQQPRLRAATAALPTLVDGRPVVAYGNRDGFLSIDAGGKVASVFEGVTPSSAGVVGRREGGLAVPLALTTLPTSGDGEGRGWIMLGYRRSGLRSALAAFVRRLLRRSHPPTRYPVRYSVQGGVATATLDLPGEGRYVWRPSERSGAMPAWSIVMGRNGARLEHGRG